MLIIKNTSLIEDKIWGGILVVANSSYSVQEVDRLRLLSDENFVTDVNNLLCVVNNGVDLTPAEGFDAIRGVTTVTATNAPGFAYNKITDTETVTIPVNREMHVKKRITVHGRLILRGRVCLI